LIAIFGGLVGCGAFVVVLGALIFLFVKKSQSDVSAADIAAGHTGGLEDWTATSLQELSRDVVGTWYYVRPFGGSRVGRMTASIHSCRTRGELFRLSAEKPQHGGGELQVVANWTRLAIRLGPTATEIWRDGAPFGSLDERTGQLSDARGQHCGAYQRSADVGRLILRGLDAAQIRPAREVESGLPHVPEPFCTWVRAAPDEETTTWVLALTALEAGSFAMPTGGGGSW
jgi:hypothetical protein